MSILAVITGDVRASKKIGSRARLSVILKKAFTAINKKVLKSSGKFEIFRGDSFQGIIKDPARALKAAVLIRARLRQWEGPYSAAVTAKRGGRKRPVVQMQFLPDARIGIGIGDISYRGKKIVESDGVAFHYSGTLLDDMKHSENALAIRTPWETVNEELAVTIKLADAIISKWSSASAETAFLYLSGHHTQQELSDLLGISQPAVHKRLSLANIEAIQVCLDRFELLIKKHIK
jgi:hypothetical protein